MTEKVTIADLARELGLSKSAVSNALNGAKGVSSRTRERVRALAEEKGWRANAVARALSRGRALAIGVCLARNPALLANEPYYQIVFAGIESVLIDSEYSLLLRMVGDTPGRDLEVYEDWARGARVDGVVLFDVTVDDARFALLDGLGLPYVVAGQPPNPAIPHVLNEVVPEASLIVGHLAELGHTHVAQVVGPSSMLHERERLDAVRARAAASGLSVTVFETDYTYEDGRVRAAEALTTPGITALVADSDLLASAALGVAAERGVRVPDELSVVSWDDSLLCRIATPTLTALERSSLEVGRASAGLLMRLLQGDPVSGRTAVPSRLVVRASSGPAPSR